MEVILLQDVAKVGRRMQVVTVSEGYAVNFLIPRGLAKAATATARKEITMRQSHEAAETKEVMEKIAAGVASIDGKSVTIKRKANAEGHLFAALKADAIATAIYDQLGVMLPESIFPIEHIKQTGEHPIALASGGAKGMVTIVVETENK